VDRWNEKEEYTSRGGRYGRKRKVGEKDIRLTIQTLFAFPTISNEISSIVLVENSEHLQKIQGQKLEARLKGKQVDLSWVDKIEDIPECTSSYLLLHRS